jgi:hypothetical protein
MRVKVDMGDAMTIPGRIVDAERSMLHEVGEGMVALIGEESRSRQIAAATHAEYGRSSIVIFVGQGVPFARIRDVGGTIVRKHARALRFTDGTFRPRARQTGIHYMRAAAARSPHVVLTAFHASFSTI